VLTRDAGKAEVLLTPPAFACYSGTMNGKLLPIPTELEERITSQVKSGRYASRAEVVREALALLEARDRADEERRSEVTKALDRGAVEEIRAELRKFEAATAEIRRFIASVDSPSAGVAQVWQVALSISAAVPREEWSKVPPELSKELDHYLYGAP